jgi:hypothetical protein
MKTKQTKIDRSAAKWLPGAMALAATTASSQAATVQITLTGNKISSTGAGGNQLVADLTGDNTNDILIADMFISTSYASVKIGNWGNAAGWMSAGAGAKYMVDARFGAVVPAAPGTPLANGPAKQSISYLNPVTFSDLRINGGAPTDGWLQVNAFNTSATSHTVELSRLIFDNASTTRPDFSSFPGVQTAWEVSAVPEASTSLGLLALGAGGLLTRRRFMLNA